MLLAEEKYKLIVINSLKYLVQTGEIVIYGYVIMTQLSLVCFYRLFQPDKNYQRQATANRK
jgi:hypothetical protein